MNTLFDNAIQSIKLGIEDYQSNSPLRPLSAVRNFYAGVLLLGKHAIVEAAPSADPDELLSVKFKPVPDGNGGVNYVPEGRQTVGFDNLKDRLEDFDISINGKQLAELNKIRNDIEHAYTSANQATVREAITKAFPVVGELLRHLNLDPVAVLGDTWGVMLEVKTLYEAELRRCTETFSEIDWPSELMKDASRSCPECESNLIAQVDPANRDPSSMSSICSQCGERVGGEEIFVHILGKHFQSEAYSAAKDGGDSPLYSCHECGVEAYVMDDEINECQWCRTSLDDECVRCGEGLTPDNVWHDNSELCDYCGHMTTKDD